MINSFFLQLLMKLNNVNQYVLVNFANDNIMQERKLFFNVVYLSHDYCLHFTYIKLFIYLLLYMTKD